MTGTTYGDHQEAAAAALNRLITREAMPLTAVDVHDSLACRDIVVGALRQRLYALRVEGRHPMTLPPARVGAARLPDVARNLTTWLDRIVAELPTLPPAQRRAPTDVLNPRTGGEAARLWREAAVELLTGSHALDAAPERPWLRDPGGGWYLVHDVAVTLEAVLILDSRLDEVGLLNTHHRPPSTLDLDQRRLLASQCARVATWYATSDTPDRASPATRPKPRVSSPVYTVHEAGDLAAAQRQLARYLRPLHGSDAFYDAEPEIDTHTVRMVVTSQHALTERFEHLSRQTPGAEALAAHFAQRREILGDIHSHLRRLVDLEPQGRNTGACWQQVELSTAVARLLRTTPTLTLSTAQWQDLATATHEVTQNLATTMRRELLRDTSNLRMEDATRQVGRTRVHRRHPLERSLTDLVNLPTPSAPIATYISPRQRAALSTTLAVTPTGHRAPSPYPAPVNLPVSRAR
ncbi:hypothetical protein ASG88_00180 [Nocardioides sp. Soil777]|uniref:hypothetical protein n=1 Tax=Nocardioides sp. Soil777 TaxID=1736409 RepID=UPI000703300B|nr:hypothetical protein [Nocardioides sp. Soil777]KRF07320.1 hypothetical protein ASG88_00180 [Nocardioides sp. Soil777]